MGKNLTLFKERLYFRGKKKKKFMQYKKSVGYPKPYHLDKITFNILPNITADILIQTFVLVCVCFFYT